MFHERREVLVARLKVVLHPGDDALEDLLFGGHGEAVAADQLGDLLVGEREEFFAFYDFAVEEFYCFFLLTL